MAEEEGLSLRTLPTGVSLLCPSAPPPPCRSHFCIICHVHLSLWVLGAVILCLPSLVPVSLDLGEDCWQCRENSGLASQLGLTARARGLASVAQGQGSFGGCIGVQCQHRPPCVHTGRVVNPVFSTWWGLSGRVWLSLPLGHLAGSTLLGVSLFFDKPSAVSGYEGSGLPPRPTLTPPVEVSNSGMSHFVLGVGLASLNVCVVGRLVRVCAAEEALPWGVASHVQPMFTPVRRVLCWGLRSTGSVGVSSYCSDAACEPPAAIGLDCHPGCLHTSGFGV